MGCCTGAGPYGEIFDESVARRDAERFRRRGLDRPGRRILRLLEARGVEGRSVLEVGGGVGGLQIELLRRGASHATNLELSAAYEPVARELLREADLAEKADRRIADIAADGETVSPADAVVLNRVVCCYPDADALVGAAADHARGLLVLTYPPPNPAWRVVARLTNAWMRVRRREFRVFIHPRTTVLAAAERRGLTRMTDERGLVWRLAAFERRV